MHAVEGPDRDRSLLPLELAAECATFTQASPPARPRPARRRAVRGCPRPLAPAVPDRSGLVRVTSTAGKNGSASAAGSIRSSSASSTRTARPRVAAASGSGRRGRPRSSGRTSPSRRAGRASRPRPRRRRASSASTRERRTASRPTSPRRCSLYARSPPILTADAAGIGSSISPRRPASAALELVRSRRLVLLHGLALRVAGRRPAERSTSVR